MELALNKETTEKPFPIKGFIAANGVTDFETDPYISTVDAYYAFSALPLAMYQNYTSHGCKYYWQGIKPNVMPGPCSELFGEIAQRLSEIFIYELRTSNEFNSTLLL